MLMESVVERNNSKRSETGAEEQRRSRDRWHDRRRSHGVLKDNWKRIREELLQYYIPSPVRRVEIPKPDGGVRMLGIHRSRPADSASTPAGNGTHLRP